MRRAYFVSLLAIGIIYFILRVSFPQTIEFGYDQPRLSFKVIEFLQRRNFLTSQEFSQETPWGNLSWGPALIFFLAPFFAFSKDPIIISSLIATFNLLSIVFVILIGWKFFSPRVGIFSGLFLVMIPWWVIFSRMIYQPTSVPTFIAISLFLLFKVVEKPKSFWIGLLIFSWGILLQTYLITISFIFVSFIILVIKNWKTKINLPFLGVGILGTFILFLPSAVFYTKNPGIFLRLLNPPIKFVTNPQNVMKEFTQVITGGGFNWQLGYGYKDFISGLPLLPFLAIISNVLILYFVITGILKIFKEKNIYGVSLAIFLSTPLWTIPAIGVEYVVPRYFLYVLPPLALIFGIAIDELVKRFGKISFIFPVFLFSWWIFLVFKYFNFVSEYNYPEGVLSHFSDPPYSFLKESFDWINKDADRKGYGDFTVSSDVNFPNSTRLNWAQKYYWDNLLKRRPTDTRLKTGHYFMYFSPGKPGTNYQKFGPYIVYEYKGI